MIVERLCAVAGVDAACCCVSGGYVYADPLRCLLVEPFEDTEHQLVGGSLTTSLFGDVDPLQLAVAIEATGAMGCHEANEFVTVDRNEDGALGQGLLGEYSALRYPAMRCVQRVSSPHSLARIAAIAETSAAVAGLRLMDILEFHRSAYALVTE